MGLDVRDEDIPADLMELAQQYRAELVEHVAEQDEEFLEKYLNGEVKRKDVEKMYREVEPCQKLPLTRRVKKAKKR